MLRAVPSLLLIAACGGTTPTAIDPREPTARERLSAARWLDESVTVVAADVERTVPRRDLGLYVDEARTHLGPAPGDGPPLAMAVDRGALELFVQRLRAEVDREPAAGRVDTDELTVTPHVVGLRLDPDRAIADLERTVPTGVRRIELSVDERPPDDGLVPEGLSFDAVVGEYETRYRRWGAYRGRRRNVETATERLDGAILDPGASLSFNERVGPRSYRDGYRMAPVIVDGEMTDGIGGGVCQVSSTLHAAAYLGGLEIASHTAHSRPSSYIPVGLDSTVVWPDVDLVIRNPFPFPVYVHATAVDGLLRVQLLGPRRPRVVEYERRIGRVRSFDERFEESEELEVGEEQVAQEGIRGRTVYRTRRITEGDRTWVEEDEVTYPPTDRIIHIGTGPRMPVQGLVVRDP